MPANEQTWRDQKKLHIIFAVSVGIMAIATIWMMAADHLREWKQLQLQDRKKDAWMVQSRRDSLAAQYDDRERELKAKIDRVDSQAIEPELINEFKAAVVERQSRQRGVAQDTDTTSGGGNGDAPAVKAPTGGDDRQFAELDRRVEALDKAAARANELEVAAAPAEAGAPAEGAATDSQGGGQGGKVAGETALPEDAEEAREEAKQARRDVFKEMDRFVREARRIENQLVGEKKTANGVRTAVVSELGIKVGRGVSKEETDAIQKRIDDLDADVTSLTERIAQARDHRMELESIIAAADADKAEAVKEFEAMKADLAALDEQVYKNTGNLGEAITRLPVVNALYSGNVRIDQNWLPDLTINYNFAQVARFDRCTTCHRGIATTAPGTATDPLYPTIPDEEREMELQLATPEDAPAEDASLRSVYGMELSESGIIREADVTVHYVLPNTLAASAGLQAGDVLLGVGGLAPGSPAAASEYLMRLVEWGKPVRVQIRRGLDHPFTSHPRLDLYLSDMSPHPQKDVGCTICHDGQGSGTSFQWTSHTPDNARERNEWARDYGWSENHHWIFPMKPSRFLESNCLKCHHQKGSLQPSERFPEPPAPKLVEGWTIVEQFGCFGCHEINGYDSPTATVGPDLRLEPPYHEAAEQILRDPGLTDEQRQLAQNIIDLPDDADSRHRLLDVLSDDESLASNPETEDEAKLQPETRKLASILKEVEMPGDYRKVGPSLRRLGSKVEYDWLFSWIRRPQDFRESTRMPQFFLQYEHLSEAEDATELAESQRLEPIEIRALSEYLLKHSEDFEYLDAPEEVTEQASAERGKWLFESRGCLACHSHGDFDQIKADQGPDLSQLASKLNHEKGRKWLYSWLRQPNSYHIRTRMPDLYLDPIAEKDAQGQPTGRVTDPAADIVEYLLSGSDEWQPENVPDRTNLTEDEQKALAELAELWLASDAIPRSRARQYLQNGIPADQESKLKADEKLLVGITDENRVERQLEFVARRTIGKYGCFGCHDIPGFEDAKPIGTALVDWGRKESSKLAFENIHAFLETHGINPENPTRDARSEPGADVQKTSPASGGGAERAVAGGAEHEGSGGHGGGHLDPSDFSPEASYFVQALNSHNRDGFLWQKLRYPRSFDYKTTRNKNFNERLRMPKFPFDDAQREAVMTFVLGLVKEPPAAKYIYKPDPKQMAIVEGRQVLERFNCAGCHTLKMEQWEFAYTEDTFDSPAEVTDYPFLAPHFTDQEIAASTATDPRGFMHAKIHGQPVYDIESGEAPIVDEDREPITREELAEAEAEEGEIIPTFYQFTLWQNAIVNGEVRLRGIDELLIPASREGYGPANGKAHPPWGGDLARYLAPRAAARAKDDGSQVNPKEAWGWLPPPLTDEGTKVQPDWLHGFLMDPYPIRPAAILRMPNFHMTSDEAAKLVDYFAAASGAQFPYEFRPGQQASYLARLRSEREDPFGEAMKIVTNGNYCVKCHAVADYAPPGDPYTFGPNLAEVYRRLRPEYTREWIANPARILHYTGMPVNIPYRPEEETLGGVSQDLYRGTSIEQLNGLVDLLMNFDAYARQNTSVTPLVQQAAAAGGQGGESPPAEGGEGGTGDSGGAPP